MSRYTDEEIERLISDAEGRQLLVDLLKDCTGREHKLQAQVQAQATPPVTGATSDGYHTFDELYDHRNVLWALVATQMAGAFKTRLDRAGDQYPGWFICAVDTPYGQISYHLPDALWDALPLPERAHNATYDGHTAQDTLERLHRLLAERRETLR